MHFHTNLLQMFTQMHFIAENSLHSQNFVVNLNLSFRSCNLLFITVTFTTQKLGKQISAHSEITNTFKKLFLLTNVCITLYIYFSFISYDDLPMCSSHIRLGFPKFAKIEVSKPMGSILSSIRRAETSVGRKHFSFAVS